MSEEYLYIESKIKALFLKGNNILLFTEKDEKKNIFSKVKSIYLDMQYNDKPIHGFFILNENLQELLDALYQEENTSNAKRLSEKQVFDIMKHYAKYEYIISDIDKESMPYRANCFCKCKSDSTENEVIIKQSVNTIVSFISVKNRTIELDIELDYLKSM